MEALPLISVIIPVYQVEAYLDKCIRSVAEQSYTNLEIILVEDGSPDRCGEICDEWAARDSRIQVIHKKNGGLSDARNAGMACATGQLMGFVDSDDWIEPDMFQLLYTHMAESDSDIAACGVVMEYEDKTPPKMMTQPGEVVLNTQDALMELISYNRLQQPVCYKLYRTEYIKNIPFPVGKCHEDAFWSYQAVARAKRVCVFDTPCYHYLQRRGSIMGQSFSLKRLDAVDAELEMLRFLENNFPELCQMSVEEAYRFYLSIMQAGLRNLKSDDLQILRNRMKKAIEQTGKPKLSRELSLKRRGMLWLASRVSLEAVCRFLNFLQDIHVIT